jgi:ribosomal protein S27AE
MKQNVVRCPYCVLGVQFRPMAPHLDGRFVCEKCGHVALADGTSFACDCYRCIELNASRINTDVSPILKIKTVAS